MKSIALGALALAPLLVLAQVPTPDNAEAFLDALARAVAAGDWKWLAVLAIIGLTFIARHYGSRLSGRLGLFFTSSRGGVITALLFALLVALAPPLAGKIPWSVMIVKDALLIGFTAIGGWVGVRRIIGVT